MRHYLPGLGRFISRVHLHEAVAMGKTTYEELRAVWGINIGPLGAPEAFARNRIMEHPYAYCGNDSVNWVDPAGHQKTKPRPKPKPQFPELPKDDWKKCISDAVGGNIIFGKKPEERLKWKKIVRCIIWAESRDDPNAKNPKSTARGLMQILKCHDDNCTKMLAHQFNPFDPCDNIQCGVMVLSGAVKRGGKDPDKCCKSTYTSIGTPAYNKCMRGYEW
jgi:hypothetical protein